MIPIFPNFKKIDIKDRKSIESYTSKYPPYSDFNFTSLWAWDTNNERMISILNDNLVVRFTDYENDEPFFSFLGTNKSKNTAHELMRFAKTLSISPTLRFVPEEIVKSLENSNFIIEEDRGNFDYVFSISELANLAGVKFKEKRHSVNKFLREYPNVSFELKELNNRDTCEQIISVLHRWSEKKKLDNKMHEFKHEEIAINRLLESVSDNKLIVSCVFLNKEMIGFSIDEISVGGYAISHFIKADNSYCGVYDFLNKKIAEYLMSNNILLWNWEQDLGIKSLERSKNSYRPVTFLKKYKISLTCEK